jgi:flagellar biosynthesis protein FlhF
LETATVTAFDVKYRDALVRRLREAPGAKVERRCFNRGELLASFARHRMPERLAHALADESAKTNLGDMTLALASAIDARMKRLPIDFQTATSFLLAGPNGVGKTACAAKLAAHAKLAGRTVLLIASDCTGAGAVERLSAFAEHLDTDIVTAESAIALANLTKTSVTQGILAIVDAAGFDPRQPKAATAFSALSQIDNVETIGVVSALTDGEEIGEIVSALAKLGATRLIVTGADLARRAGAIAAAVLTPGIAIAHVTRSPFVAGGLETPTALSLARLLAESEQESAK